MCVGVKAGSIYVCGCEGWVCVCVWEGKGEEMVMDGGSKDGG